MLKNPYLNALVAAGYIGAIVLLLNMFQIIAPKEDTPLAPVVMLSLLVLSVAVMSALFFYQPARMFLDGDREGALKFFAKTIAAFAGLTALFVALLLLI